jgi:molybdenum cofactor cytidylyltransferase
MTSDPMAIVLAAGRSSRMGAVKALLDLGGELALARVLRLVREASLRASVVLGHHADAIRAAIDFARAGVGVVVNPAPDRGQSSSVQCGAASLPPGASLLLWPVDHARVEAATLATLLAAFRARDRAIELVVPSWGGRRGHPLLAGPAAVDELRALRDGEPAHQVLRRDPARVHHVEVADRFVVADFDTPQDLAR